MMSLFPHLLYLFLDNIHHLILIALYSSSDMIVDDIDDLMYSIKVVKDYFL